MLQRADFVDTFHCTGGHDDVRLVVKQRFRNVTIQDQMEAEAVNVVHVCAERMADIEGGLQPCSKVLTPCIAGQDTRTLKEH